MPVSATPVDPRLTYNYTVEIDGLEVALVQKINIPEAELVNVEHKGAGAAHSTHTAGRWQFGEITLLKAMPADASDQWAWKWMTTARDPVTGQGSPASAYKKNISIIHYGSEGTKVIDRWECEGVYCRKVSYSDNDGSQDGDRMIETVVLRPDRYRRL